MSVYIIPIHGLLGSPEGPEDKAQYFPFDQFLIHVNNARVAETIQLDIASDGGYVDVAEKMIEVLRNTKKPIVSKNSGNVCSAASKIFTLAPKGSRFYDPSKGVFLIHNPWGAIEGDSDELAKASKELDDLNKSYAKWYANATGSDIGVIEAFMDENKPLTPEQVETLGFAEIVNATVNAVAKIKTNNTAMENKQVIEKMNGFEKMLKDIKALFRAKAIMIADVNGTEIEFPDLNDPAELAVGVKANVAGAPAVGEFVLPDGRTVVCVNGEVTEIKEPAADPMQALKDENADLKKQVETLTAENTANAQASADAVAKLEKLDTEFRAFKASYSKGNPGGGKPPASGGDGGEPTSRSLLKKRGEE